MNMIKAIIYCVSQQGSLITQSSSYYYMPVNELMEAIFNRGIITIIIVRNHHTKTKLFKKFTSMHFLGTREKQ